MFNKEFSSLNRTRRPRPSASGGFHTINRLNGTSPPSSSHTQSSSPSSRSVDLQLKKSELIRHELENLASLKTSPSKSPSAGDHKRDILQSLMSISLNKLDMPPTAYLVIKQIDHNGEKIQDKDNGQKLMINISPNDKYIYFTMGTTIISGLIINRIKHVHKIRLSVLKRSLLIELQKGAGYVYINYLTSGKEFTNHLKSLSCVDTEFVYTNGELLKFMEKHDEKREKDSEPNTNDRSSTPLAKTRISPIDPGISNVSTPLSSTRTRTRSMRQAGLTGSPLFDNDDDDDDGFDFGGEKRKNSRSETPDEVPEKFEPPLHYKFLDSKNFIISNSDFKTLYNNDWINDNVIDFFIKYDIEQAVKEGFFKAEDIYAFNSFFFNKLMTKPKAKPLAEGEVKETPPIDYYGNIKRWLNKIDLMSFPYVIIPINENLHWYCCVIKGLPTLLKKAQTLKKEMKSMDEFDFSLADTKNDRELVKDAFRVEIFVFDSLSHKHSHIHFPLKKFIIDYCKDKYDLDIVKEQFRVVNARVPKQNNFNDCGIHVIYNVRKLLSDATECERLWKSGNSLSRHQSKLFFKASERNGMRKMLRDTLKRLQQEENTFKKEENSSDKKSEIDGGDDEEDIEIIEVTPPDETAGVNTSERKADNDTTPISENEPDLAEIRAKAEEVLKQLNQRRTLDPKSHATSFLQSILRNRAIRRQFAGKKLPKPSIEIVNSIYPTDSDLGEEELKLIAEFTDTIKGLFVGEDDEKIEKELVSFFVGRSNLSHHVTAQGSKESTPPRHESPSPNSKSTSSSTPNSSERAGHSDRRPKDESFVIQPFSDNEDLNESVSGLQISEKSAEGTSGTPVRSSASSPASVHVINTSDSGKSEYKSFPNKRRKLRGEES